jgi:alpha-beta hydrolase superfamily lysophospholipase
MQAEIEYLVDNKQALAIIEKAGSRIKDYVLFKGAFHEL